MKTTSNKDMLNAIRNQASAEYQERIPAVMDDAEARSLETKISSYQTIKNEFINTLINKVVRTDFFSKVYENPLKMLKRGTLNYGTSIEELFVIAADAKGFFSSGFDGSDHAVLNADTTSELINKVTPDVKALYITRNFAHYFKTSISDAQLKSAFNSANGLSELVNQIVGSLTNGAEQKEYKDMIKLLNAAAQAKQILPEATGLIGSKTKDIPTTYDASNAKQATEQNHQVGVVKTMKLVQIRNNGGQGQLGKAGDLMRTVKGLAGRMKFVSDEYNMAGVKTFCNPEDLVLLVEPETAADIDIDALAVAFNVSATDMKVRIIIVDELPKQFNKGKKEGDNVNWYGTNARSSTPLTCKAILMDKNFIQAFDTLNEARTFENGRALTTNMFLYIFVFFFYW